MSVASKMPQRPSTQLALVLLLLVLVLAAAHKSKKDDGPDPATDEPHHKSIELRHFHHHHRHYHHYRDRSKHCKCEPPTDGPHAPHTHHGMWQRVAALLLALVVAVLGSCAAVGLWRRFCARHPGATAATAASLQLQGACPLFGRRGAVAVDAPLLQPPPTLADKLAKEAPPPYKETWA